MEILPMWKRLLVAVALMSTAVGCGEKDGQQDSFQEEAFAQETVNKVVLHAAEDGDAQAQRSLGMLYYYGVGVKKDRAESVKWLRKAADQGDEAAKKMLSEIGE